MNLKILAAAAVLLITVPAFAQGDGFLVSASAGQSRSPGSRPVEYVSTGSELSWGLTGGYRINQYIGVEGGYRDLGQ